MQIIVELRPSNVLSLDERLFNISATQISYEWEKMQRKIGIHGGLHRLRDTFATKHYEMNKDLYLLSEILGHADIKMTKRYTQNIDFHRGIENVEYDIQSA